MDTIQKYFNLDKSSIAFLKFILEAYDGIAVMRTLDSQSSIVELMIAPDFEKEVDELLTNLRYEFEIKPIDPPSDLREL